MDSRSGTPVVVWDGHSFEGHRCANDGGPEFLEPFAALTAFPPSPAMNPGAAAAASATVVAASSITTTTAVTRSYSDLNPVKMLVTYGATTLCYSVIGHPLFLAIARQQCSRHRISVYQIMSAQRKAYGIRGWFRGVGVAAGGAVVSEVVYFFIVEFMKERLPLTNFEWRSFGAGLLADLVSTPLYVPFAVISQKQMVAGCGMHTDEPFHNSVATTRNLIVEGGYRALFRGTLLSASMAPLAGTWWLAYELMKAQAYCYAPAISETVAPYFPAWVREKMPAWCTSTTDNMLINCSVGATASCIVSVALNPLYVLRLRLQVGKRNVGGGSAALAVARDVLHHEGVGAFFKGVKTNMVLALCGGCAFGATYEGTKKFSDVTLSTPS